MMIIDEGLCRMVTVFVELSKALIMESFKVLAALSRSEVDEIVMGISGGVISRV